MSFSQRIETAKPYFTGFVLGLIAAPILAFGTGWVSTSAARAEAVENARIETLASVCSHNAEQIGAGQNTEPASLKGYDNRDKRAALVASAMAEMLVPDALAKQVTRNCDRTLS
jgi:hypothetical protein